MAALGDRAAWLLAHDESGDMFAARHRLFERVLALLGDLAVEAPLVLVLEDLHWADESSHELLAFLAVRLRDLPVLVVATLRDEELADEARRWLSDLERRPRVTRLRLAGLAPHEVAELVADQVPEGSGPDPVAAVVRAAEGNPLYALELAGSGARVPPASITEAVLAKAAGVAPSVRAVVDQVCVADGGMSHELLAATVPLGEDDLLAAAREAVSRRLLAATADGYAFPHDLIRQVFYGQLLPGERRRLHRRVAGALAARPEPDPALLALHWQLADCPDRAAPAALLAARQAVASRAYPEADRFYTMAVAQAAMAARARSRPAGGSRAGGQLGRASRARRRLHGGRAGPARRGRDGGPGPHAGAARPLPLGGRRSPGRGRTPPSRRGTCSKPNQCRPCRPGSWPRWPTAACSWASPTRRCRWRPRPSNWPRRSAPTSSTRTAWRYSASSRPSAVSWRPGWRPCTPLLPSPAGRAVSRAWSAPRRTRCTCSTRPAVPPRLSRSPASGRRAARSLGAPAALTSVLDNNTAAVLTATGRWAEAGQLLAELIGESRANVTRYLQLLQLELAVGRGERDSAEELATTLRKSPEDPRLLGPLHACLAEQALNAGDLSHGG